MIKYEIRSCIPASTTMASDIFITTKKRDAQRRKRSFGRLSFYFLHRWTVRCIPAGFPHTDGGHRRNGYFVPVPGWSPGRIRAGSRKTDWHFDLVEEACLNHMCFDSSLITSKRARKGFGVVVPLSEKVGWFKSRRENSWIPI